MSKWQEWGERLGTAASNGLTVPARDNVDELAKLWLAQESQSTRGENGPSATFSTTNLTRNVVCLNSGLRGDKTVTDNPNYGI